MSFSTTPRDWRRRTSPKWFPILCRVRPKTSTRSNFGDVDAVQRHDAGPSPRWSGQCHVRVSHDGGLPTTLLGGTSIKQSRDRQIDSDMTLSVIDPEAFRTPPDCQKLTGFNSAAHELPLDEQLDDLERRRQRRPQLVTTVASMRHSVLRSRSAVLDAACCYRRRDGAWSVCVGHTYVLCKNGWTDCKPVWGKICPFPLNIAHFRGSFGWKLQSIIPEFAIPVGNNI